MKKVFRSRTWPKTHQYVVILVKIEQSARGGMAGARSERQHSFFTVFQNLPRKRPEASQTAHFPKSRHDSPKSPPALEAFEKNMRRSGGVRINPQMSPHRQTGPSPRVRRASICAGCSPATAAYQGAEPAPAIESARRSVENKFYCRTPDIQVWR